MECILRAKNTPSIPDRNGSVKRPEKVSKSTIAITSARCKELEADTSVQLSQIVPTMTNCDHSAVMKRHEMKRLAGSGLSRWPWRHRKEMKLNENGSKPEQQVITTLQVHTDDQSVLPGILAKSFVGQSFASPLCPPAVNTEKKWSNIHKRHEVKRQVASRKSNSEKK